MVDQDVNSIGGYLCGDNQEGFLGSPMVRLRQPELEMPIPISRREQYGVRVRFFNGSRLQPY